MYLACFDGSSRNQTDNLASIGYIIAGRGNNIFMLKHKEIIGHYNSSVEAEYIALIRMLEKLYELNIKDVIVRGDCQSVIYHLIGRNKMKTKYKQYKEQALELLDKVAPYKLEWKRRNRNFIADRLTKKAYKEKVNIL